MRDAKQILVTDQVAVNFVEGWMLAELPSSFGNCFTMVIKSVFRVCWWISTGVAPPQAQSFWISAPWNHFISLARENCPTLSHFLCRKFKIGENSRYLQNKVWQSVVTYLSIFHHIEMRTAREVISGGIFSVVTYSWVCGRQVNSGPV